MENNHHILAVNHAIKGRRYHNPERNPGLWADRMQSTERAISTEYSSLIERYNETHKAISQATPSLFTQKTNGLGTWRQVCRNAFGWVAPADLFGLAMEMGDRIVWAA